MLKLHFKKEIRDRFMIKQELEKMTATEKM